MHHIPLRCCHLGNYVIHAFPDSCLGTTECGRMSYRLRSFCMIIGTISNLAPFFTPVHDGSSGDLLDNTFSQVGRIFLVQQQCFLGRHVNAAAKLSKCELDASISTAAAVWRARPNVPLELFRAPLFLFEGSIDAEMEKTYPWKGLKKGQAGAKRHQDTGQPAAWLGGKYTARIALCRKGTKKQIEE